MCHIDADNKCFNKLIKIQSVSEEILQAIGFNHLQTIVEWPKGTSPSGSLRTGRESLPSSGSYRSAYA